MPRSSRRVADAVDAVSEWPDGITVTELARQLEVNKGTASRLLASMHESGFVRRLAGTQRYTLSQELWAWGVEAMRPWRRLCDVARPAMIEAVRSSGVRLSIATNHGRDTISLEGVVPRREGIVAVPSTTVIPVYASSFGRAVLAYEPPEHIDWVLSGPVEQFLLQTRSEVEQDLAQVRELGYALYGREHVAVIYVEVPHSVAIAVPVFGIADEPVAAVGWSGTEEEFLPTYPDALLPMLFELSRSLSSALGASSATRIATA